jgi:hypothetical protein
MSNLSAHSPAAGSVCELRRNIIISMRDLVDLFAPKCTERETLDELAARIADRQRWKGAHGLFERVRRKNLAAGKAGDALRQAQYAFEESCAKALYNLSGESAPFDADSPYWIVPNAIFLARRLHITDADVLRIVAPTELGPPLHAVR